MVVGKKFLAENVALRVRLDEETFVDLTTLPDFHHYTIDEWKYFLESFFATHELQFEDIQFEKLFFNTTKEENHSGELSYAVEAVLFAWIKKHHSEQVPTTLMPVKIHGLYSADVPFEAVPDCVKIKIRPGKERDTAEAINQCLSENHSVHFRFDGNRTFDLSSLLHFLQFLGENCPAFALDFIEEPFINGADFFPFQIRSAIPLALDESLPFFLDHLEKFPNNYLILKPGLLGLSKCFELTKKYTHHTIISSTYETPSAMTALYALASLNPDQYHGLDTLKFLPKSFGI